MRLSIQGIGAATPIDDSFDVQTDVFPDKSETDNCMSKFSTIQDLSPLYDYVPKRKLRRVDHFSRMALLAAGKAIKDTSPELLSKQTTGIILATGFGALKTTFDFLDSYIEKGDKLASPTFFSNSVHNAAAAHISTCYRITGPNLTVSQFDMSFISALITAKAWLDENKVTAVLVGACDSFCDVLGYCIGQFAGQYNLQNYHFGENAVFLFLTREGGKSKYGYLDKISIESLNKKMPDTVGGELTIISPSAIDPCNKKVSRFIYNNTKTVLINRLTSPTDCGMNLVLSKFEQEFKYIKFGQRNSFGSFIFSPH